MDQGCMESGLTSVL